MIAFFRAWIAKYEVFLMLGICAIMLISGWRAHGIYNAAQQTAALQKALDDQQAADKKQFDHDLGVAKAQAIIDRMNDDLNQRVENEIKNHPVNCLITDSRKLLINEAITHKH